MLKRVLSLAFWVWIAIATLVFTLLVGFGALLTAPFDRTRWLPQRLTAYWARAIMWANPTWRLTITGQRHIPSHGAYVLVSNHASLADIIALYQLKSPFKWIAKDNLFRIPLLGWSMDWAGNIHLVRGERRSIRSSFAQAMKYLQDGVPVMVFPEGTRTRTGRLGPFKRGAFQLAIKAHVPLIPIVVTGTRNIITPNSWVFHPAARIRMHVLPPIAPPHETPDAADRLRDKVSAIISEAMEANE